LLLLVTAQASHHDLLHAFRRDSVMVLLTEGMVSELQPKMRTLPGFLNVGIHLQVQRVRVFGYPVAQPGEHRRQFHALGIVFHLQEFFEIVAAQRAPYTPAERFASADDGQMKDPTHIEILTVGGPTLLIQEGLAAVPVPAWRELCAAIFLLMLFLPVDGGIVAEIEAGTGVPFLAAAALPAQVFEVIERHRCARIADAGALIAAG